jgi:hypothetical protein
LAKYAKTHLQASVGPTIIFRFASARHKRGGKELEGEGERQKGRGQKGQGRGRAEQRIEGRGGKGVQESLTANMVTLYVTNCPVTSLHITY